MTERDVQRAVLDLILPIPATADERYFHQDLSGMSDAARQMERERVRLRLLLDPSRPAWLVGRLDALDDLEGKNAN